VVGAAVRILVTGSRDWTDGQVIEEALLTAWLDAGCPPKEHTTVVHGGARGADSIADAIARRVGLQVEVHHPVWRQRSRDGVDRGAGVRRNQEMVDAGADVCLAFILNGSRGATHCADAAVRAGIPTRRVFRGG
jgi:hypothetical protein